MISIKDLMNRINRINRKREALLAKNKDYQCDGLCMICIYYFEKGTAKDCNPDTFKKLIDDILAEKSDANL